MRGDGFDVTRPALVELGVVPQPRADTRNTEEKWTDFANQKLGGAWTGGASIANPVAAAARLDLASVARQFNEATGGHAVAIGDDKLDFGDGRGPVDVIRDLGDGKSQFWFGSPFTPREREAWATGGSVVPTAASGTPPEPGQRLSTVPWNVDPMWSEISGVRLPSNDPTAAMLAAAQWVRQHKPELLPIDGGEKDRPKRYEAMTYAIGLMRANGYDATRVVNHPTLPVSDPVRVSSDALVLNGRIFDLFRGGLEPQVLDVGANDRAARE